MRASTAVEARVLPGGPLVGRTIAEVGLRSMKYAFVLDIAAASGC